MTIAALALYGIGVFIVGMICLFLFMLGGRPLTPREFAMMLAYTFGWPLVIPVTLVLIFFKK